MTYREAVDYLFNATPVFERVGAGAYKEGLYNTLVLDEHFGHPHRKYKTVHVAGTNGKGSCSHTLASILQAAGYKVGLYTSPHLVDFRERIKVNGICVSEEWVSDFVESERAFFAPLHPSFFELTTAMAFKYFEEQNVDYAVIEVGLGGRLDCTNIINPVLSVITNISYDHTQFLGDTLCQIATEKAGIIKKNVSVVVGEYDKEVAPVFISKAKEMASPIYFADDFNMEPYNDFFFELQGLYQKKNMRTIICSAKHLGLDNDSIREGLCNVCESTGLMGRWQKLNTCPLVICDTGHNVGGWRYLSKQIKDVTCPVKRIVFGMVDDKDIDAVMNMLPSDAVYYWTQASSHRAIPCSVVKKKGEMHGLKGTTNSNVYDAYRHAFADSGKDDFIFVGGSSYVVADLLTSLKVKT